MLKRILAALFIWLSLAPVVIAQVADVASEVAVEQVSPEAESFLSAVGKILGDKWPAVIPILLALMLVCRAASDVLLIFAKKSESKKDDKAAEILGKVSLYLSKLLSYPSFGVPKVQVEKFLGVKDVAKDPAASA